MIEYGKFTSDGYTHSLEYIKDSVDMVIIIKSKQIKFDKELMIEYLNKELNRPIKKVKW